MKNDRFLIGIIAGIVLLVVVAVIVVLVRDQAGEYVAADRPEGVAHNYFLAIQRLDYDRAYSYLSDELKSKPDLDDFITNIDNFGDRSEASLKIGQSTITNDRARVEVSVTTYRRGGLFDSGSYTNWTTAHFRLTSDGAWQLLEFPYPYWGYDWNESKQD